MVSGWSDLALGLGFESTVRVNKQTNKQTCLLNHGRLPLRVVTLPLLYALGPSAALAELK